MNQNMIITGGYSKLNDTGWLKDTTIIMYIPIDRIQSRTVEAEKKIVGQKISDYLIDNKRNNNSNNDNNWNNTIEEKMRTI